MWAIHGPPLLSHPTRARANLRDDHSWWGRITESGCSYAAGSRTGRAYWDGHGADGTIRCAIPFAGREEIPVRGSFKVLRFHQATAHGHLYASIGHGQTPQDWRPVLLSGCSPCIIPSGNYEVLGYVDHVRKTANYGMAGSDHPILFEHLLIHCHFPTVRLPASATSAFLSYSFFLPVIS